MVINAHRARRMIAQTGSVWECLGSEYNAAMTAVSLGYSNGYGYRGGMHAWNQARLPVVRSKLLKDL